MNNYTDTADAVAVRDYTTHEAMAVADRGEGIDVRNLTSFEQLELNDAFAVLEQFGTFTEHGGFVPDAVESSPFKEQALRLSMNLSITTASALRKIREKVCQMATGDYYITSVMCDDDTVGPLTPSMVFVDIPTTSPTFLQGKREAMAVWYQPTMPWTVTHEVTDRTTGELVEVVEHRRSTRQRDGYTHVVRYYAHTDDAATAGDELRAAWSSLRKITAAEARRAAHEDPARYAGIDHTPARQGRTSAF